MRSRILILLAAVLTCACRTPNRLEPVRALLVTGGLAHDYPTLAALLTRSIEERVHVKFDVRWGFEALQDPDLGKAYDVIVYDMCWGQQEDGENAARIVFEGKPAVMVHAAMHCFPATEAWARCCGMKSSTHDPFQPFRARKLAPAHPLLRSFPDDWSTPGDELYQMAKLHETATPLLNVRSPLTGAEHVVAWVNRHGKGVVFATTLGHDVQTAQLPDYQRLLAYGVLWVCGKLDEQGRPLPGYGTVQK